MKKSSADYAFERVSKCATELRAKADALESNLGNFARAIAVMSEMERWGVKPRNYIFLDSKMIIDLFLPTFKAAEPILDMLQDRLGIEFDRSSDQAESGWRQYTSKNAPWLRVDVNPDGNSEQCRRVQVGVQEVPIYKFECDEGELL